MNDFRATEGNPFYLVSYFEGGKVFHGLKKDRLNDIPRNLLDDGDFAIVKNKNGENETFVWTENFFESTDNFKNQWDFENKLGDIRENVININKEINSENKKENKNRKLEVEDTNFVPSNSDNDITVKNPPTFFRMTSEEMKKYYNTLGDLYKKCWVENLHYKLNECKVSFANDCDKELSARIELSFNCGTYRNVKFVILIRNTHSLINGKLVKTGYTSKLELETQVCYDITLIRLIDTTCDLLHDYFRDCNLEDEKDVSKIMEFLKLFD